MRQVQVRVKIFREYGSSNRLEDTINNWIVDSSLGPADITNITQSECGSGEEGQVTISVWYIPRDDKDAGLCYKPHPKRGECGYLARWHGPEGECPTSEKQARYYYGLKEKPKNHTFEDDLHWLSQFPAAQRMEILKDAAKTVGLPEIVDMYNIHQDAQDAQDAENWLTENLPETDPGPPQRPGAIYGVDV